MPQFLYVVEAAGVNIRSLPSVNGPRVGVLKFGTEVQVTDETILTNGYTWRKLATGRYIAQSTPIKALLVPRRPAGSPPDVIVKPQPATREIARTGLHFIGPGSPNQAIRFTQAFKVQSKRPGPMVSVNEPDALNAFADANPNLLTYRHRTGGGAEPSPFGFEGRNWSPSEWWMRWYPDLAHGVPRRGYGFALSFTNEVFTPTDAWVNWWLGFMRITAEARTPICVVESSVGAWDANAPAQVARVARIAEECLRYQQMGINHVMCFNTYWMPSVQPYTEQTFTYMMPVVNKYPSLKWFIRELGWETDYHDGAGLVRLAQKHFGNHAGCLGWSLYCEDPNDGSVWKPFRVSERDYPTIAAASR